MGKKDEIQYLRTMSRVDNKSMEHINQYHLNKPYCDYDRARHLMDMAQILQLLPAPPAHLLDLGVGSGWTSKMFGLSGYTVLGADISPDMVELARTICAGVSSVQFVVADFENFSLGEFDCAVIYEALHHADDPQKTVNSVYANLKKGGVLVTIEPGRGHEEGCKEITHKYGTTEKDMEPTLQRQLMTKAGFSVIKQYIRLDTLPLFDLINSGELEKQSVFFNGTLYNIQNLGLTCIMVAIK